MARGVGDDNVDGLKEIGGGGWRRGGGKINRGYGNPWRYMGNPWVHGKSKGNPWEMTDPRTDRHGLNKVRNLQATVASILENHEIYENLSEIREIGRNLRNYKKGYKN